jgi:hypothetical protein
MRVHLLAALCCLGACRPAVEDTPEAAYRAFALAANHGEDAAAFARLTASSQKALRARVAGLDATSGGAMKDEPAVLVFHGGHGQPLSDVRLLKKQQDRATVSVTAREETHEVNLRREDGEWRVELPGLP